MGDLPTPVNGTPISSTEEWGLWGSLYSCLWTRWVYKTGRELGRWSEARHPCPQLLIVRLKRGPSGALLQVGKWPSTPHLRVTFKHQVNLMWHHRGFMTEVEAGDKVLVAKTSANCYLPQGHMGQGV